jgi:hypothetical protein
MLRVTDDILELRGWGAERGGLPCRLPDGRLTLCFGDDPSPALEVGWGEFEATFCAGRSVVVYDDAPGARACFIGNPLEVRDYVQRADARLTGGAPPDARTGQPG